MTKNVNVVDEFGNNYGETYLKRAKQLVKKGRAHFIDKDTISLVCPPDHMEDNQMSVDNKQVTQEYILNKIDQILNDKEHILKALEEITNLSDSKGPGDMGASSKADAIGSVIATREMTNQKLIDLLTEMFHSIDENSFKREQTKVLLKYVDDPVSFENAKEALNFNQDE